MKTGKKSSHMEGYGYVSAALAESSFGDIAEPGAYLATESGRIIRVTALDLGSGEISVLCPLDTWVARLSLDPSAPIGVLREIAGSCGYFVNF